MWKDVNNVETFLGANGHKFRQIPKNFILKNGKKWEVIPENSHFEKSLFFDNKIPI